MHKVKVGQIWKILETKMGLIGSATPEDYLIVITKIRKNGVADFFYLDGYDSGRDEEDDINIPWLLKNGQLESDVK